MSSYIIEIEVLTPLFIGAGQENDWAQGSDFIVEKSKVYLLDQKKLLNKISIDELTSFLGKQDDGAILRKVSGNLRDVSYQVLDCPVDRPNDIKAHVKNKLTNKPIIPGSSLKGAIRSVLFKLLKNGTTNERAVFGDPNDGSDIMRFVKVSDTAFEVTKLTNTKIFNLYKKTGTGMGDGSINVRRQIVILDLKASILFTKRYQKANWVC